jgi:hypothetical protein
MNERNEVQEKKKPNLMVQVDDIFLQSFLPLNQTITPNKSKL